MSFLGVFKKYCLYLNGLLQPSMAFALRASLRLFKIVPDDFVRENLAANLEQIPSKHSYGYAFSGICPSFFAIFPLNSVPFMKYAG
jgi:hypothetical protein